MRQIIEYDISHLDYLLILHIKSLREQRGLTQEELSLKMKVSRSFVGNVESLNQRHKYSIRHLNLIAKAFGFKKLSELMDIPTPKYDRIRLVVELRYNTTGTRVISSEIIETLYLQ